MSLSDVAHQGFAHRLIQRAVSGNRVPHAYLFHGPDGVGKEKLALGLAELLLCGEPVNRSVDRSQTDTIGLEQLRVGCGKCEDCRMVTAETHPDLHLVYRQLNRMHPDSAVRKRKALDIGVDVLRQFVIEKVHLTPARGRAKVFVIREADRITPQAQNALLKTLEEPPDATVLILLVTALDRLLPTTLSRCQVVRFDALPMEFVHAKLATLLPDVPAERIKWYARCSGGSLGRALQYAGDNLYDLNQRLLEGFAQPGHAERRKGRAAGPASGARNGSLAKLWTDESKSLGERYRKRDPDITETEASRRGLKSIFQLAAEWYADILRAGSSDESTIVNKHWTAQIQRAAESVDAERGIEAVNRIARAERQLDLNANTQLCIEALLVDLPQ